MPRQQFESVIAQATRKQLKIARLDVSSASISVGQFLALDLYAPVNKIGYVKNVFFRWTHQGAITATSGDYTIMFEVDDTGAGISPNFCSKVYPYNNGATFDRFTWFAPTTGAIPASTADMIEAIKAIVFDSTRAFRVTISNGTNATINGIVECYVLYEEEEVRL